jgi:hypothetical protein
MLLSTALGASVSKSVTVESHVPKSALARSRKQGHPAILNGVDQRIAQDRVHADRSLSPGLETCGKRPFCAV